MHSFRIEAPRTIAYQDELGTANRRVGLVKLSNALCGSGNAPRLRKPKGFQTVFQVTPLGFVGNDHFRLAPYNCISGSNSFFSFSATSQTPFNLKSPKYSCNFLIYILGGGGGEIVNGGDTTVTIKNLFKISAGGGEALKKNGLNATSPIKPGNGGSVSLAGPQMNETFPGGVGGETKAFSGKYVYGEKDQFTFVASPGGGATQNAGGGSGVGASAASNARGGSPGIGFLAGKGADANAALGFGGGAVGGGGGGCVVLFTTLPPETDISGVIGAPGSAMAKGGAVFIRY